MKRNAVLILAWFLSNVVFAQVDNSELEAIETYIEIYPNDKGLLIREYGLSTLMGGNSIEPQIAEIKSLIESNSYSKSRFGLEGYAVMQESMFLDQGIIIGEYILYSEELNPQEIMQIAFSRIMNLDVDINITEERYELFFEGDEIEVRYNNAEGIYERDNEKAVFWDASLNSLELVFGSPTKEQSDYSLITPYFGENVSSPQLLTEAGTSPELQYDYDIAKLKDIEKLSGYIEEYKSLTGEYPLQGITNLQNYVFIATEEQQQYTQGGPNYEHVRSDTKEFIADLQSALGSEIDIPFDPQRIPVNKPNFYIYMIEGDEYYLAVHLFESYTFSNQISEYYNKLEITNSVERIQGQWLREELLSDLNFIQAISREPNKPGYIEDLRMRLGGNNAF